MKIKHIISALAAVFFMAAPAWAQDEREDIFGDNAKERVGRTIDLALVTAVQLYEDEQYPQAFSLLTQAAVLAPDNAAVQYYLAMTAAHMRKDDIAMKHMMKAYELDSTNYWYGQRLASFYQILGNSDEALKIHRNLMRMRPNDLEVLSAALDAGIGAADYELSDSLLNRIERINGANDYSRLARIELLRQKGEFKSFFADLKDFFADSDMDGAAKKDLISRMLESSDSRFNYAHLQDYTELLDICLEKHPSDTAVAHYAGMFFYSTNKKRALELAEKWPADTLMLDLAMAVHSSSNDFNGMLDSARKFLAVAEADGSASLKARAHAQLGDCYQNVNQNDKACKEYELSLELEPNNANTLNNYAYLLVCMNKNISKAARMSQTAVEMEPGNASYLDTYAWILHKQKKYKVAKSYFKKAMIYGGKDSAVVLEHYAETLDALGESTLAKVYREQAALKRKNESR